jgi:hypothetical protein
MAEMSPAAQEVLDAFLNGYACKPSCNVAFEADRNGIAAALRAAADQGRLGPDHWEGSQPDERELGWNAAMEWVEKIAAELETSTAENR